jgi:hypothetical protein
LKNQTLNPESSFLVPNNQKETKKTKTEKPYTHRPEQNIENIVWLFSQERHFEQDGQKLCRFFYDGGTHKPHPQNDVPVKITTRCVTFSSTKLFSKYRKCRVVIFTGTSC